MSSIDKNELKEILKENLTLRFGHEGSYGSPTDGAYYLTLIFDGEDICNVSFDDLYREFCRYEDS